MKIISKKTYLKIDIEELQPNSQSYSKNKVARISSYVFAWNLKGYTRVSHLLSYILKKMIIYSNLLKK